MGSRTWIKVYCENWLSGSLREESPEIRGVWIDLLALAGSGEYGDTGEIKLSNGIGFTDGQIAEILCIKPSLWRRAKKQLVHTNRIEISPKGAIRIINWSKYQSEYERQKRYREAKQNSLTSEPESPLTIPLEKEMEKESEKLQSRVTTESYKGELQNKELSAYSFKGSGGLCPPESPLSRKGGRPFTAKVTHKEHIRTYLEGNGPAPVKDIALATGIDRNTVNVYLHKGKGKLFVHFSDRRMWGVKSD